MLTLLLGPDDFSKKQYVSELAAKKKAGLEMYSDAANPPMVENLIQQDLFSQPKVSVLQGLIAKFRSADVLERLIASQNQIIIIEDKLDKRLNDNKALLANKNIETKEFHLPHGKELNSWLAERFKHYGAKISPAAIELLAIKLGRDEAKETKFGGKVTSVEEIYNLWQADSEVQKLVAYAAGNQIEAADVEALASQNSEPDVFDLINAIAENKREQALLLVNKFLESDTSADEKGKVIQLNALLAEQFRNVAVVQDFVSRKVGESEILEKTEWKSGRLFIMKKIASRFKPEKVLDLLGKLKALDSELKTSNTPPQALLDLILVQLLA